MEERETIDFETKVVAESVEVLWKKWKQKDDQRALGLLFRRIESYSRSLLAKFMKTYPWLDVTLNEIMEEIGLNAIMKCVTRYDPDREGSAGIKTFMWIILERDFKNYITARSSAKREATMVSLDSEDGEPGQQGALRDDNDIVEDVIEREVKAQVQKRLAQFAAQSLSDRELYIWRERTIGIDGRTLESVGKAINLTRERVRQIENDIKRRLQDWELQVGDDGIEELPGEDIIQQLRLNENMRRMREKFGLERDAYGEKWRVHVKPLDFVAKWAIIDNEPTSGAILLSRCGIKGAGQENIYRLFLRIFQGNLIFISGKKTPNSIRKSPHARQQCFGRI